MQQVAILYAAITASSDVVFIFQDLIYLRAHTTSRGPHPGSELQGRSKK